MSELAAILMPGDKLTLASWLIETYNSRFVVDDGGRETTEVSTLDALRPTLLRDLPPSLFVVSDRWSNMPLYKASTLTASGVPTYYIMQRHGGPAFHWVLGNVLSDVSPPAISSGLFMDYPSYYTAPGTFESVPRPTSMSDAFSAVRAFVRRTLRSRRCAWRKTGKGGPWVSENTRHEILAGTVKLANSELTLASDAV